MDVVLQALDTVNEMFDQVRNGEEPTPADPALLERLAVLAEPEGEGAGPGPAATAQPEPVADESTAESGDDITDDEFEQLLDALDGEKAAAAVRHACHDRRRC